MNGAAVFVWLVLAAGLIVVEASTFSMVCIWFAIGAFASACAAYFGVSYLMQLAIFLAVSTITLLLTKGFVEKCIKVRPQPTNADVAIGKKGTVIAKIGGKDTAGQVKLGGIVWTASSEQEISEGELVEVLAIEGVKLMVKRVESTQKAGV